jgi:crotonobetainyl-CoA:carnitine CoA-transferase CaiB-like acyl-CoA transferase
MGPAVTGALAGLRVIDLTQMLSGPYATMLLADLGADVIKVEPLTGDTTRGYGPRAPDDDLRAYGGYFASVNRNKRSVALDLGRPEGRGVLIDLARTADVLVENFRAGVMDRLGLSYETLHEVNARLVYAAIRGFGDPRTGASPYADWPAYDVIAQAMGGIMGITGPSPAAPTKVGAGIGDLFPAALAATGLLAAVLHARQTGAGQFVDVAMYDGVLSMCERLVYLYDYSGTVSSPQGNTHPLFCPFDSFPCLDGHVTIAAPNERQWSLLCAAMGRAELAEDERFRTNSARLEHADLCRQVICEWTGRHTRSQVMTALAGRVPAGPVHDAADIAADPHVAAREMIVEVDHPGSSRKVRLAGTPIKMTESRAGFTRAPLLSEHATQVLGEAGYDARAIADLRTTGVLG